jgi:hypothetical protein
MLVWRANGLSPTLKNAVGGVLFARGFAHTRTRQAVTPLSFDRDAAMQSRTRSAAQNPALPTVLGLNLLAGYLMKPRIFLAASQKIHINQQLEELNLLAGYLIGLTFEVFIARLQATLVKHVASATG